MVTTLRALQIIVALLIIPMAALGGMAMFSGGGQNPDMIGLGPQLVSLTLFIPLPAIIIAEIVYRLMKHSRLPDVFVIPVVIAAIPLLMWGWLIVRLRMAS